MELNNQKTLAKHIFRLLKVNEISFPIGRTPKGNLAIKFSSSSDDIEIMLDSVPLPVKDMLNDENNIELKRMMEKYWFEQKEFNIQEHIIATRKDFEDAEKAETILIEPKKRGRPAKSK